MAPPRKEISSGKNPAIQRFRRSAVPCACAEREAKRPVESRSFPYPLDVTERGVEVGLPGHGPHRGFGSSTQRARNRGGPARERGRRVEQGVVGHAAPDEPDLGGARTIDRVTEQHHRRRGRCADGPFEQPGVPAAGVQPDAKEARVEAGRGGGEADVAREGQIHARSDGGAVDGSQRGKGRT